MDEPAEGRIEALRNLPIDDDSCVQKTDTRSITGETGFNVAERLWVRPAVEVLPQLAGDPQGIPREELR